MGETLFSLAFKMEAVILVEIGMSTHRTKELDLSVNDQLFAYNFDWLEEKREESQIRVVEYQSQVPRYYNAWVKPRQFQLNDLVLRKVTQITKNLGGKKTGEAWEGPYRVTKIVRPRTYHLETMERAKLKHPWNVEHLKKFYK